MAPFLQIGQVVLGRYEVVDFVGDGGEGTTVKALDHQTGNMVAIKQLAVCPDSTGYDEMVARFQRAAQISIGHPNVLDPIDYGEEDGEHYLVTPFVDAVNLEAFLRMHGPKLPVDQAVHIVMEIAKGLDAIHAKGIVHRDIKPPNIMVCQDGSILIIDFGICRNTKEKTITNGTKLHGSLYWMSREQAATPGTEDHRSDVYSLGAMFYFMLVGVLPVRGSDAASIILSICQYVPDSPRQLDPSIPLHIDHACMRALAKQREARFQSASEFIEALNAQIPYQQVNPYCPACGFLHEPSAIYCNNCGAPLNATKNQPARCLACGAETGQGRICSNCQRSFGHTDHRLAFNKGTVAGTTFRIPEGIYRVGRNELSPRDYHISRQHLSVACLNGSVFLEDTGSTNKTYIAGRPITNPTALLPGQEVCIAGNIATYTYS